MKSFVQYFTSFYQPATFYERLWVAANGLRITEKK